MSRRFGLFCAGTLFLGVRAMNRAVLRIDELLENAAGK